MDSSYSGPKMEARAPGGRADLPQALERLAEDPFFYGYRWIRRETARGVVHEQVPLTKADLLDPQEDDHVSNHSWHEELTTMICSILRALFKTRGRGDVRVTGNVKMLWQDRTIDPVDPDVAVIPGVKDPPSAC